MLQKINAWSAKRKIIVGGLSAFGLLVVIMAIAGGGQESDTPAQSAITVTAPEPVIAITAQQLYDEREANATRFDANYKSKRVRVSGQVVSIDGGSVTLGVDATGFGIDESGLFGVKLDDLSTEEQVRLSKGQRVSAVCKVGNYILGTMMMEDCELD